MLTTRQKACLKAIADGSKYNRKIAAQLLDAGLIEYRITGQGYDLTDKGRAEAYPGEE